MKKKILVLVAAVVVLVWAVATAAAEGILPHFPGEGVDGIIDMSQLPATQGVVDRNGNYVGDVFRKDLDSDGVVNVYKDGEHVGYFSPNGFYRLDEPPPVIEGKETWVEEWGDDPNKPARKYRKDE